MGLPRNSTVKKLPRDFPYQPNPIGWAKCLAWESSDDDFLAEWEGNIPFAPGRGIQMHHPGIMPCNSETAKTDEFKHFQRFKIRCGSSGHETTVHNCVVLKQSQWLRDQAEKWDDPDAPIVIPLHIQWWQLAWVLEYMYEGRVPGFHLLAGEDWPRWCPGKQPRSIAWGLLELWRAADFFGLDGLKRRAKGAFGAYFASTIRVAGLLHGSTLVDERPEDTAMRSTLRWPENRVTHEFCQAVWRIFGDPHRLPNDYYGADMTDRGSRRYTEGQGSIAENARAIRAWESAMFDKPGAPDKGVDALQRHRPLNRRPAARYPKFWRGVMVNLTIRCARFGLFKLKGFQEFVSDGMPTRCPVAFKVALAQGMAERVGDWPRYEYPRAPISFERVDPSRSTAPNAMRVPAVPLPNERESPVALMFDDARWGPGSTGW